MKTGGISCIINLSKQEYLSPLYFGCLPRSPNLFMAPGGPQDALCLLLCGEPLEVLGGLDHGLDVIGRWAGDVVVVGEPEKNGAPDSARDISPLAVAAMDVLTCGKHPWRWLEHTASGRGVWDGWERWCATSPPSAPHLHAFWRRPRALFNAERNEKLTPARFGVGPGLWDWVRVSGGPQCGLTALLSSSPVEQDGRRSVWTGRWVGSAPLLTGAETAAAAVDISDELMLELLETHDPPLPWAALERDVTRRALPVFGSRLEPPTAPLGGVERCRAFMSRHQRLGFFR